MTTPQAPSGTQREQRRLTLVEEWAEGPMDEPAPEEFRLTAEDWHDLRATASTDLISAATVVAARVNDPDIAALPEFVLVEQRSLDVLLVGDPGVLTRAHRTLVVTAAMRLSVVNGEPVHYTPDPLDELRGRVAKHVLDWTVRTATL
jgi:hypothetical protein